MVYTHNTESGSGGHAEFDGRGLNGVFADPHSILAWRRGGDATPAKCAAYSRALASVSTCYASNMGLAEIIYYSTVKNT